MVTPEEARIAADRLEAVFEGSLPTVLRDMADTVERLEAQRLQLREALLVLSLVPVEDFGKETKPDYLLMGWNEHRLYVRDVIAARAALRDTT